MKRWFSILILNLFFVVGIIKGQNKLDGNFNNKTCELRGDSIKSGMIQIPKEECYLTNWKSIGGTQVQLIENDERLVFGLNFGKEELVGDKYLLYRDYLQGQLDTPLEKEIWYKFTAEIKVNVDATVGVADFEVFFGDKDVSDQLSSYQNKGVRPQIRQRDTVIPYNQFDYKKEWKKIERYYKGKGGEAYIIIGNFKNVNYRFSNISREVFDKVTGNLPNASYMIKEIKLEKIEPPKEYVNEIPSEIQKGDNITLSTIEFETNESEIKRSSYEEVEELANLINQKGAKVHIVGHTDSVGDSGLNMTLSEKRAESLKVLLVNFGVKPQKISTAGEGEESPIAENETREGRSKNRRVEIKILEIK